MAVQSTDQVSIEHLFESYESSDEAPDFFDTDDVDYPFPLWLQALNAHTESSVPVTLA